MSVIKNGGHHLVGVVEGQIQNEFDHSSITLSFRFKIYWVQHDVVLCKTNTKPAGDRN